MKNELRPNKLVDIVGNENIKKRILISIDACKLEGRNFPHTLITGSYGLGKTTFACSIAHELESDIQMAHGANLDKIKKALPLLSRIKKGDFLFIDEIHRCSDAVCEYLYTAIEDNYYIVGNEETSHKLEVPDFTLIGATTNQGLLPAPFLSRFINHYNLESYKENELSELVQKSAQRLKCQITTEACIKIAKASRGIPRVANTRLLWIKDYSKGNITGKSVLEALKLADIHEDGYEKNDLIYIKTLLENKKPMGLKALALASGLPEEVIENNIEPFLLQKQKIKRTPRGRVLNND